MTMHDGGPTLQTDRRSQSTTIGIVLILAITLLGTGLVVGYGSQALADTERATTLSKVEHSLTQFDSQAAIVALGESPVQQVDLGEAAGGTFSADDDDGWIRVVHHNATGNGSDTVVYNATLGSVQYRYGDTTIGYQGGGVWRQSGNGSTMISQPEFNYRGGTLTLPVIRVTSDGSAAGETTALLRRTTESEQIYPDRSETYSDGRPYANPVMRGSVVVTVQSDFYEGWAAFFDTRTSGNVSVDHDAGTASVELRTVGAIGEFQMTDALDDDGLEAIGQAEGHSLESFSVDVEAESQGNGFNNHYLSFYADSGNHRFEYLVYVPSGVSCKNGISENDDLVVKVFYRNTSSGVQHEWENSSVPAGSGPIRLECHADGSSTLSIEMTSDQPLTYGNTTADGTYYDWSGDAVGTAEFNHPEDNDATFTDGEEAESALLARHYIALLGDDFTLSARSGTGGQTGGGGAQIDYGGSGGTLDYETGGDAYITYLHISESEIVVEMR